MSMYWWYDVAHRMWWRCPQNSRVCCRTMLFRVQQKFWMMITRYSDICCSFISHQKMILPTTFLCQFYWDRAEYLLYNRNFHPISYLQHHELEPALANRPLSPYRPRPYRHLTERSACWIHLRKGRETACQWKTGMEVRRKGLQGPPLYPFWLLPWGRSSTYPLF